MSTDFDAELQDLLGDVFSNFGRAAIYTPPAGSATACTVVENKADDQSVIGDVAILASQRLIEVRVSEIASPQKGGRFRVGSLDYVIVGQPRRDDPDGLVWSCLCRPDPV